MPRLQRHLIAARDRASPPWSKNPSGTVHCLRWQGTIAESDNQMESRSE